MDDLAPYFIAGLVAGIFTVGMFLTAPTEEDIGKCVEVTNYTYERCQWELSR